MVESDTGEATLIAKAQAGDAHALHALVQRQAPLLRARIRKWLSPALLRKVSHSDILQEASLVALRRIGEFEDRGPGSFGRWLGRIVELKTREFVRRYAGTEKRGAVAEVSRGGRRDTAQFAGRVASPSQMAMAAEMRERIRAALKDLPEDYREVIRLVQQEGFSMAEVAAQMGRSRGAVKMLYGRALSKFAELLDVADGRGS